MPFSWFLTTFKTDKLQNEQDQQGQQQQQQQHQQHQQHDENIYEDATTGSQQSDAHSRFPKLYFFHTVIEIKQKLCLCLGFPLARL